MSGRRSVSGGAGATARAAIILALALAGRAAHAQPARLGSPAPGERRLEIVAPLCPSVPFDLAAFLSILRVEVRAVPYRVHLAAPGAVDDNDGGDPVLTLETVPCDPATTTVEASYRNPRSGRRVRLNVDLADVAADARARVLSLVLAELLRDGSGEHPIAATPPAPPVHSDVPVEPPARAPAEQRPPSSASPAGRLGARIAVDARAYRSFDVPLVGGRVGASAHAADLPLRAVLDLIVLSGYSDLTLGSVDTRAVITAVGIDWTAGGRRAELAVGPRLEGGWGWIAGRAGDASVRTGRIDGPLAGLSLAGSIAARLTRRLEALVEIEAGLTLAEVVGLSDGARAAGFSGPWAAARLGMQIDF